MSLLSNEKSTFFYVTVLRFNDVYILNEKYIGMYVKFFSKALASGTLVISNPK